MQGEIMYLSETLARDRHRDQLDKAREARLARHARELHKLERARHRAERKLLRAWRRSDEVRTLLEDEMSNLLETVA
jgi:hypothetical protein